MAEMLIDAGASINIQNFNGATALIYAATFNQKQIVALLITNGADTSIKDSRGQTAADHAKMQGSKEIFDLIVAH